MMDGDTEQGVEVQDTQLIEFIKQEDGVVPVTFVTTAENVSNPFIQLSQPLFGQTIVPNPLISTGDEPRSVFVPRPTAKKTSVPPPFTRGTRNLVTTTIERCLENDDEDSDKDGTDRNDEDTDCEEMITGEVNDTDPEPVDDDVNDDDADDPEWSLSSRSKLPRFASQPLKKRKKRSGISTKPKPSTAQKWNQQFPKEVVAQELKKRGRGRPPKKKAPALDTLSSVKSAINNLKKNRNGIGKSVPNRSVSDVSSLQRPDGSVSSVSNVSRPKKKRKIEDEFTIEKMYKTIYNLIVEGEKLLASKDGKNHECLEDVCYHLNKCISALDKDVDKTKLLDLDKGADESYVNSVEEDESDDLWSPEESSRGASRSASKRSPRTIPVTPSTTKLQFKSTEITTKRSSAAGKKNVPTLKVTDYLSIDPLLKSDKTRAKRGGGRPRKSLLNPDEDSCNARDGLDSSNVADSTMNDVTMDDTTMEGGSNTMDSATRDTNNDTDFVPSEAEKDDADDDFIDSSDSEFEPPGASKKYKISKNPKRKKSGYVRKANPKKRPLTEEEKAERRKEKELNRELRRINSDLYATRDPETRRRQRELHKIDRMRKNEICKKDPTTLIRPILITDPRTGMLNEEDLYIYLKFDKSCPICGAHFTDKAEFAIHEPCHTKRRRLLKDANPNSESFAAEQAKERSNPSFKYWFKESRSGRDAKNMCLECGKVFTGDLDKDGLPIVTNAMLTRYKYHCYKHYEPHFTCKICNENFNYEFQMLEHCTTHDEYCQFQCIGCRKLFDTREKIMEHINAEMAKIKDPNHKRGNGAPKHHLGYRVDEGRESNDPPIEIKRSFVPIIRECRRANTRERCIMYVCMDCPHYEEQDNFHKLFFTRKQAEDHVEETRKEKEKEFLANGQTNETALDSVKGHKILQLFKCNCVAKPFLKNDNFLYHIKWNDKHQHKGEWIPGAKRRPQSEWRRKKGNKKIGRPAKTNPDGTPVAKKKTAVMPPPRFKDTDGPIIPVPNFEGDEEKQREQLNYWLKQFFGYKARPDDVPADLSVYYPSIPFEETCTLCNQTFTAQNEFIVHDPCFYVKRSKQLMEQGIQEGPRFQCDACAGAFSSLEALQKHVSKHVPAQFKCVWDKLVGVNREVDCRDPRAPKDAPPGTVWRRDPVTYKWKLEELGKCEMTFNTSSSARNHIMMRHLNWKGYYCRWHEVTGMSDMDGKPCNYRYYRTEDMRAHVLVYHINYKPHKCNHCEFRTADISLLRDHARAWHEAILEDIETCPVEDCKAKKKTFAQMAGLIKHLRKFHPGYDEDIYLRKKRIERNRKPGRKTIEGEGAIFHSTVKFKIVNGQTVLVDEEETKNSTHDAGPSQGLPPPSQPAQNSSHPVPSTSHHPTSSMAVNSAVTQQAMTDMAVASLAMYQTEQPHTHVNHEQIPYQSMFGNVWQ